MFCYQMVPSSRFTCDVYGGQNDSERFLFLSVSIILTMLHAHFFTSYCYLNNKKAKSGKLKTALSEISNLRRENYIQFWLLKG